MKIVVTGANGQLGRSIRRLSVEHRELDFIFTDIDSLTLAIGMPSLRLPKLIRWILS